MGLMASAKVGQANENEFLPVEILLTFQGSTKVTPSFIHKVDPNSQRLLKFPEL